MLQAGLTWLLMAPKNSVFSFQVLGKPQEVISYALRRLSDRSQTER